MTIDLVICQAKINDKLEDIRYLAVTFKKKLDFYSRKWLLIIDTKIYLLAIHLIRQKKLRNKRGAMF